MAQLAKEDAVKDLKSIKEFLETNKSSWKDDYVDILFDDFDFDTASPSLIQVRRKQAQIYAHEAITYRKHHITKRIEEINKELRKLPSNDSDLNVDLEFLKEHADINNPEWDSRLKKISNYALDDIKGVFHELKKFEKQGMIKINKCRLDFDYDILEIPTKTAIGLLEEKLDLISETQKYDRFLQMHSTKALSCTVPDSTHEINKENIEKQIAELMEGK